MNSRYGKSTILEAIILQSELLREDYNQNHLHKLGYWQEEALMRILEEFFKGASQFEKNILFNLGLIKKGQAFTIV